MVDNFNNFKSKTQLAFEELEKIMKEHDEPAISYDFLKEKIGGKYGQDVLRYIKKKYNIQSNLIAPRKSIWLNPWYEGGDE